MENANRELAHAKNSIPKLIKAPKIIKENLNNPTDPYKLIIQTANAYSIYDCIFSNYYDPNTTAETKIEANQIAMHVSTVSTSETHSNLTIAEALFE